jgi:hypothetical protein
VNHRRIVSGKKMPGQLLSKREQAIVFNMTQSGNEWEAGLPETVRWK